MYSFSTRLNNDEKRWIFECIEYVKLLNIPISNEIYFKHSLNYREAGWCDTEEDSTKAECTIGISIHLSFYEDYEIDFKETCIHELLHTIPNRSKNPHKGSWEKYAKLINSLYDPRNSIHKYYITERYYKNTLKKAKEKRFGKC